MRLPAWLPMFLVLFAAGCGKEAGRVPLAHEGKADGTVTLSAGDVAFWTDIDLEYEGDASLIYKVELKQGAVVVGSTTCDPLARLSVKTSWTETNIGDHHSRHGNGKMDCSVKLAAGGPTAVHTELVFTRKPKSDTFKKADLVLRQ